MLAKDLLPEAEVAIVISATTAGDLPADMPLRSLGHHRLRGLEAPRLRVVLRDVLAGERRELPDSSEVSPSLEVAQAIEPQAEPRLPHTKSVG